MPAAFWLLIFLRCVYWIPNITVTLTLVPFTVLSQCCDSAEMTQTPSCTEMAMWRVIKSLYSQNYRTEVVLFTHRSYSGLRQHTHRTVSLPKVNLLYTVPRFCALVITNKTCLCILFNLLIMSSARTEDYRSKQWTKENYLSSCWPKDDTVQWPAYYIMLGHNFKKHIY